MARHIIRGDIGKNALFVDLDATDRLLRSSIEGPHSADHVLGERDGATNTNECTVCTTLAHHGRNKTVQQFLNLRTPRREGDARWE